VSFSTDSLSRRPSFNSANERCWRSRPSCNPNLRDEPKIGHGNNPLRTAFINLQSNQTTATQVREWSLGKFHQDLKDLVRDTERRLDHFGEKATTVPAAMKDADVSNRLPLARKLPAKLQRLGPIIGPIIDYQTILGPESKYFPAFANVQPAAEFAVRLY
jgi:hypothetical protein